MSARLHIQRRLMTYVAVLLSTLVLVLVDLAAPAAVADDPQGAISLTITDAETGLGIGGVTLNIADSDGNGTSGTTDPSGAYSRGGWTPGNYRIGLSKTGYQAGVVDLSVTDGVTTTESGSMHPFHMVQGSVSTADGKLVTSGQVVANYSDGTSWQEYGFPVAIDGSGHYSLQSVAGDRRLCVVDSDDAPLGCYGGNTVDDATTVTVPTGQDLVLNLQLGKSTAPPPAVVKPPIVKSFSIKRGPSVSGVARVGRILTVSAGSCSPSPSVRYQWLRAGHVIAGAAGRTRLLRKADKGKRLSVRVAYSRSGYRTISRVSSATAKVKKRKK